MLLTSFVQGERDAVRGEVAKLRFVVLVFRALIVLSRFQSP